MTLVKDVWILAKKTSQNHRIKLNGIWLRNQNLNIINSGIHLTHILNAVKPIAGQVDLKVEKACLNKRLIIRNKL